MEIAPHRSSEIKQILETAGDLQVELSDDDMTLSHGDFHPAQVLVDGNQGFVGWGLEDAELGFRLLEKRGFELVNSQDLVCYHLQGTQNNPLRAGSHENIVGTLHNLVYFSEKWPDLRRLKNHTVLRHVELDLATDRWSLISSEFEPAKRSDAYDQACDWLRRNGQFPTVNSSQRS